MNDPVRILTGDVLDSLRTLPDGCVQCCCTSPPYYGLRDYGTGTWEGGDPSCPHAPSGATNDPKNPNNSARNGKPSSTDRMIWSGRCTCGAVKVDQQIGLEPTPEAFIEKMVAVFAEVRRVLRDDGTLWLNIGDSYWGGKGTNGSSKARATADERGYTQSGGTVQMDTRPQDGTHDSIKPKDLCMMPWRVALALQADGWYLRSVIVWAKKSPMPESVRDRPTSSWEPIFLLAKSDRYFYDAEAVKEKSDTTVHRKTAPTDEYAHGFTPSEVVGRPVQRGGKSLAYAYPNGIPFRNQRNVWHLGPEPYSQAHFATFPTEIPRRAILAGTSEKGCCPECGAGWERVVERATGFGSYHDHKDDIIQGQRHEKGRKLVGSEYYEKYPQPRTTGWQPTCTCPPHTPIPCTVLDPFLGSGTTIAVARQLGRNGIGCELNPEYVKLAEDRIGKAEKPHTYASKREDDSPLFTEEA